MRLCFLVTDFGRSGGLAMVLGHARRLAGEPGFDVDVVSVAGDAPPAAERVSFPPLEEALGRPYDAAISTWWETAAVLWRLRARRRVAFLQSAEDCFYTGPEAADRLGAALSMRAADEYVVVSGWLAELVRGIRPGAPVHHVPNGVAKDVFDGSREPRRDGPLRVLVEGQPSIWFKGVGEAVAAVRAADAPIELTVVSPGEHSGDGLDADRVVAGVDQRELARLYGATDLVVKLSRLEGLGLVPLEAFHHGVPCVVTPYGGHADYVRHGVNGFVAGFDDPGAVTRYVERIDRDADLWRRLSEGALATAAEWPDPARSSELFADALRRGEEGSAAEVVAPMLHAWRESAEQDRGWRGTWHEQTLAETRAALEREIAEVKRLNDHVAELEYSRLHVADLLKQRDEAIEQLTASRAYRAAVAARSIVNRVRR